MLSTSRRCGLSNFSVLLILVTFDRGLEGVPQLGSFNSCRKTMKEIINRLSLIKIKGECVTCHSFSGNHISNCF